MIRDLTVVENASAPSAVVWARLSDVMTWSAWTPTINHIEALSGRALRVGSRFGCSILKRGPAVWTVTHIDPGQAFAWETSMPGLRLWANHTVEKLSDHECRITLELRFSGLLGPLAAFAARRTARGYLALEATSLKHCAEDDVRSQRRGVPKRGVRPADAPTGGPEPDVEDHRLP